MASLARVRVHPVKSLDPLDLASASVLEDGGLTLDREYAIRDAEGRYVNGKRERAVHRVDSTYDPREGTLALRERGEDKSGQSAAAFHLPAERPAAADWLAGFLGYAVSLDHDETGGFPDDTDATGPTVVSTATLETVAGWFDLPVESVRRRFRANLEVDGVPAFWEDRLYAGEGEAVRFRVGDAVFDGVNPCARCVVPSRDPDTGEETPAFRRTFVENREATLPAWADESRFDHYYRLIVNTTVPEETVGESVAVGDDVAVLDGER
ncbi:MOSC domain-containing protein [Halocalculus aciditolerans]|uniref:Molybdenum cofactor biosysynthesis protein n=1 Tax=Halocalculus aciditolerans TaxID=1383812 RepID=A0A830FLJ0_9EURY|nr:MOSC N-terminal beta barrel domain-containing protein [Halocalculus aciditolerans]GGL67683.1 molybdenum cofactor biosysynthesis protein [Halocalculus aciditolerans]